MSFFLFWEHTSISSNSTKLLERATQRSENPKHENDSAPCQGLEGDMREGLSKLHQTFQVLCQGSSNADSIHNSTMSSYLHTRCGAGGSDIHIASSLSSNPCSTGAAELQYQVPPSPLSRLVGVSRCWLHQPTTQQPSFHEIIAPALGVPHFKENK